MTNMIIKVGTISPFPVSQLEYRVIHRVHVKWRKVGLTEQTTFNRFPTVQHPELCVTATMMPTATKYFAILTKTMIFYKEQALWGHVTKLWTKPYHCHDKKGSVQPLFMSQVTYLIIYGFEDLLKTNCILLRHPMHFHYDSLFFLIIS